MTQPQIENLFPCKMGESRSHIYDSFDAEIMKYEETSGSSTKKRKPYGQKVRIDTLTMKSRSLQSGQKELPENFDKTSEKYSTLNKNRVLKEQRSYQHKESAEQQAIPAPMPKTKGIFGNRMLSLSTSSLSSLIPGLYSLGSSYSMPSLRIGNQDDSTTDGGSPEPGALLSPEEKVSDELARESDVTVSTNITSQAEYKGFASYVISGIFLIIWLSWSLLPDRILNDIGIFYYPSRWWALAIPAWILILMIYTYAALALYNIERKTMPLDDLRTIVDTSGIVVTEVDERAACDWWGYESIKSVQCEDEAENVGHGERSTRRKHNWKDRPEEKMKHEGLDYYVHNPTSGIWDLPITKVNDTLYSEK